MFKLVLILVVVALLELGSPQGEVVSDKLHDGGGIFVDILIELLDVADGLVEGFLGELAGLGWVIHDLVVED